MKNPIMESVSCDLCGGARQREAYQIPDRHFHHDEWFTAVECLDCGLGFVNPRPVREAMDRYYPKDFFEDYHRDANFHHERYRREAAFLQEVRPPSGAAPKLLDIGCANGAFPRVARGLGWDVEGVEVAASADAIGDFSVYRVPFPEIPVTGPRYDALTAWAVLEHVHDPMAYFRKAAEVLKPGGVFIFLVHNFESISSRYLFREDVPRHLYFFSVPTVTRYLNGVGLTLERTLFDDSIFEMAPLHWLRFYLRRLIGMRPLTWSELPESRVDYCRRKNLPGIRGRLSYALTHPFTTLDRILMPAFANWQKMVGSYGTIIFIARKPPERIS